jgi:hypothetical protein
MELSADGGGASGAVRYQAEPGSEKTVEHPLVSVAFRDRPITASLKPRWRPWWQLDQDLFP